ncbi:MAG: hypothetical protein JF606_19145 [Burkholderiales bacterium]|nr:hypothetical protein [Burkholderiales bacterium]
MKRILNDGSSSAGHQAQTSQSEDGPSLRRTRLSALTPPPEGMPADRRRSAAPGTLAPRTAVFPARFGLPHELLEQPGELHLAPPNDAEIGEMIHELLEQPGELHFLGQTQASDGGAALQSRGQTICSGPDAPAPCPAALLLQANEQAIEAAITLMCRYGLTREAAEHATGLRAGVLAAVVDVQGRWLDDQAQFDAVATLPPAQLQAFALMLQRVRGNLQHAQAPVPATTSAAPSFGQALQQHELYALIEDILTRMPRQQGEAATAAARRIHHTNEQVRALPYAQRISVLAMVTGAREADLRRIPELSDMSGPMAQQAQDIRMRVPQQANENRTAWARRIRQTYVPVRDMPYAQRISVLAMVTGVRAPDLRTDPLLRDISGPMAQQAQDILMRMPQQANESRAAWARRIGQTDVQVRNMPYVQQTSVLALVTGVRENVLRRANPAPPAGGDASAGHPHSGPSERT